MALALASDELQRSDFNVDYLKWDESDHLHNELIEELKDRIETKGFVQLVKGATRFWPNTLPSLIDQTWTNCPDKVVHCKNLNRPVADHNMIFTQIRLKGKIRSKHEIITRNWKQFQPEKFQKLIQDIDWDPIYSLDDPNIAYSFLEERMKSDLDATAPIKKVQPIGRNKTWIRSDTLEMIKDRDFLRNIAIETNNQEDWKLFRTERNKVLLKKSMEKWPGAAERTIFNFRDVTILEVTSILKDLGNTTTMGHDKLDPLTLKLVAGTIIRPVQHILNTSLNSQIYVNKWKLGKLIPLHKGEGCDSLSTSSYRPISILPVISKIMEKAVQMQVLEYLENSNQLNKNLHGYKSLHSTTTTMIQLTDFIGEAADDKLISNVMMVDQSAAFDCVDDQILDIKLGIYNFSDNARKWFRSYMSHRSQYVQIGAAESRIRTVKSGVPQGSVLGPMLYTIFLNELPEIVKSDECENDIHNFNDNLFGQNCYRCGILPCFADDCTIAVASKTQLENKVLLNEKMGKITDFLQSNRLCINQSKTKTQNFMVHQKRARVEDDPDIMTIVTQDGQKTVSNTKHGRILGLNLEEDLGWRSQLETGPKPLLPCLRKRVGQLRHIGRQIPKQGRLILANGLIVSKIIYMIQVWGGGTKYSPQENPKSTQ